MPWSANLRLRQDRTGVRGWHGQEGALFGWWRGSSGRPSVQSGRRGLVEFPFPPRFAPFGRTAGSRSWPHNLRERPLSGSSPPVEVASRRPARRENSTGRNRLRALIGPHAGDLLGLAQCLTQPSDRAFGHSITVGADRVLPVGTLLLKGTVLLADDQLRAAAVRDLTPRLTASASVSSTGGRPLPVLAGNFPLPILPRIHIETLAPSHSHLLSLRATFSVLVPALSGEANQETRAKRQSVSRLTRDEGRARRQHRRDEPDSLPSARLRCLNRNHGSRGEFQRTLSPTVLNAPRHGSAKDQTSEHVPVLVPRQVKLDSHQVLEVLTPPALGSSYGPVSQSFYGCEGCIVHVFGEK
jgi:hypothetical protein